MRKAEDTLAIYEVVVRYGFWIDDREWDAARDVFTQDATLDLRVSDCAPSFPGFGLLVGLDAIVEAFRGYSDHPYQHMLVSHLIDDISDSEVVVRSKALFPMRGGAVGHVVYVDRVVRTDAGWRIKHKSIKRYRE
jgi:hypothetical protein